MSGDTVQIRRLGGAKPQLVTFLAIASIDGIVRKRLDDLPVGIPTDDTPGVPNESVNVIFDYAVYSDRPTEIRSDRDVLGRLVVAVVSATDVRDHIDADQAIFQIGGLGGRRRRCGSRTC